MNDKYNIYIYTGIISVGLIGAGSYCLVKHKNNKPSTSNSNKIVGVSLTTLGSLTAIGCAISYFMIKDNIDYFQHNINYKITKDTYIYVAEYKRQLLQNTTNLMNDIGIRFVISHGNLIEYERERPIYHDDDLDIRFCNDDFDKWADYCNNNDKEQTKYNLLFDNRFNDIKQQKLNGIQASLIQFKNDNNITSFTKMEIHVDLISNNIETEPWIKYNIDYNNLRKITCVGIDTYAPNKEDTVRILTQEYGPNYIIPNKTYTFDTSKL